MSKYGPVRLKSITVDNSLQHSAENLQRPSLGCKKPKSHRYIQYMQTHTHTRTHPSASKEALNQTAAQLHCTLKAK